MNPYDFVPFGTHDRSKPERQRALGHLGLPVSRGEIRARLSTLGPFLIAQQDRNKNQCIVPLAGGAVIPGSSLKGLLRSVAEIVGPGCVRLSHTLGRELPKGFAPCTSIEELCPACRIFGALWRGGEWRGLARPGDARLREGLTIQKRTLYVMVGSPKPSHRAFYFLNGKPRGRKLYYHHAEPDRLIASLPAPAPGQKRSKQLIEVHALEPRLEYDFSVLHEGLDDADYRLLLYALFLSGGEEMAHKLGWGKPMGLGSVRIAPLWITREDPRRRYREGAVPQRWEGDQAVEHVRQQCRPIQERSDEVMQRLRALLRFPEPEPRPQEKWRYPDHEWFKAHSQTSLEEFNKSHG